jgi:hypothetical protein
MTMTRDWNLAGRSAWLRARIKRNQKRLTALLKTRMDTNEQLEEAKRLLAEIDSDIQTLAARDKGTGPSTR